jgi:hypothetical protein
MDTTILLHVPKTGGTSVYQWAARHLNATKFESPWEWLPTGFIPALINYNHRPDMVIGHNVGLHKDYINRYAIIIRNPADWLVSVYNNDATNRDVPDFETWYNQGSNTVLPIPDTRNRFCAYIRSRWINADVDGIIGALSRFRWILTTDSLKDDIKPIAEHYGIPADIGHTRKAGEYDAAWRDHIAKRYVLTDEMRERIYNDNTEDVELYEWAKGSA